jgi:hypothetical protein
MWIIQRPLLVTEKNGVSPTASRSDKTVTEILDRDASHRRGSDGLIRLTG